MVAVGGHGAAMFDLHRSGSRSCYTAGVRGRGRRSMDDELLARVRQLHAQGLSTNAITRALGASRGRVAPLVRIVARERRQSTPPSPAVECWVSAGWSVGLTTATASSSTGEPPPAFHTRPGRRFAGRDALAAVSSGVAGGALGRQSGSRRSWLRSPAAPRAARGSRPGARRAPVACGEQARDSRWQLLVDEQFHAGERSRWKCTSVAAAYSSACWMSACSRSGYSSRI